MRGRAISPMSVVVIHFGRTHLSGGISSGHGRRWRDVAGGQLRRHRGHRRAGRRHRRRVTARYAVMGGRGRAGRRARRQRHRTVMVRGRRDARRRGRRRHAADDHCRRRHGLVVGRPRGLRRRRAARAAALARRPVGRRGLAGHDRLRVPALVARAVLSERTAVVPGPAASIAVRVADAENGTQNITAVIARLRTRCTLYTTLRNKYIYINRVCLENIGGFKTAKIYLLGKKKNDIILFRRG